MRGVPKWAASAVLAVLGFSTVAWATPYWIVWEGNDFPENQGWQRFHGPNGAEATRTLSDGTMTIDGIQTPPVYDFARIYGNGSFDPDSGETFVMQWRMRVDEVTGPFVFDAEIGLVSDGARLLGFVYGIDVLRSVSEPGNSASFVPGVFHQYELRSLDMYSYELSIDGLPALTGVSVQSVGAGFMAWGDSSAQATSRTTWDYVRFGVIPEARTSVSLLTMGIAGLCMPCLLRRK